MSWITQINYSRAEIIDQRITDSYSLHRCVYDLFDRDAVANGEGRILWRAITGESRYPSVLVVSPVPPMEHKMLRLASAKTAPASANLFRHKHYAMSVKINARVGKDDNRKYLYASGDISNWIEKRLPEWGLSADVDQWKIEKSEDDVFRAQNGNTVKIISVPVSGMATCENPDLLRKAFIHGIGRSKSFGCGLIHLKPQPAISKG